MEHTFDTQTGTPILQNQTFKTSEVKPPVFIDTQAVKRLNKEGWREHWEPLKIIDEAREATYHLPDDKIGIVLGSGENTPEWKQKGWKTLDIDSSIGADFTVDANYLETVNPPRFIRLYLGRMYYF